VLMSPVIVLGGIYSGYFTPMEAAAISSVYAIFLALCYGVSVKGLLPILTSSAKMSSIIMMILAGAQLFGYAITSERIPHVLFDGIMAMNLSSTEFLVGVMLLFFLIGMALEVISVILITMPILMPMIMGFDIDPVFFGMLLILNMEIAVITPPIGLNLFAISAISKVPVMRVFKGCLPFVLLLFLMLVFMTFVPQVQDMFRLL
ncbi:MAG TPA: TRAP transporter large permease, partial [Pusillimonas sp.]|nr:TRAP transporter large permease [Pusillimonas sp.]